ncbi:putative emp24 gp25L p24 family GOLD [Trypanosoma vivax]|uniref:Putative Cop-coated vesicle membrane protein n=1 Tax=Trypanosoma vivax (strain Y486) TaxID=1055687 RepID=G0U938_TRYVY|nr:putative Cop-coated vesicle membrane protein [Trypanosoma vivax]KAH8603412.1 putative emp24 gp25L p24 family GOLD [Trypanosoma vivax]CCC54122.1 putative Cop-coated vesicle membrane protein [Trypanosoma vivax Y486]
MKRPCLPPVHQVTLCVILFLLSSLHAVHAGEGTVSVKIPARRELCFFEEVSGPDVKMFLHYSVTSGGALDIDTTIRAHDDSIVWLSQRDKEGRILFKSRAAGRYNFCFSNKMSSVTGKVVTFSIIVDRDEATGTGKVSATEPDPIEHSIMTLRRGLREVQDVQRYLRLRERVHRATSEVANTRVVIWSTIEILAILSMSLGNVWYLRRIFNKRRVV